MPTSVFQTMAQDTSVQSLITALNSALAALSGGNPPAKGIVVGVRGSDGKIYSLNGVGTGDGGVALQTFSPAQGSIAANVPNAAFQVAFKDVNGHLSPPNLDGAGALAVQSGGTPGSPVPARGLAVGGKDGSGNLQVLSVNSLGEIISQAMGTVGTAAPAIVEQIGGVDSGGNLRAAAVTTAGALSVQDASAVPEAPLSINGVAFTLGQAGAPSGAVTVNTASTLILPDSTGGSSINGIRGQLEIVNPGNVDVFVSPSLAAAWGALWLIRPGGSLITTYSGPVSAITQNTTGGVAVGSPVAQLSVAEWA